MITLLTTLTRSYFLHPSPVVVLGLRTTAKQPNCSCFPIFKDHLRETEPRVDIKIENRNSEITHAFFSGAGIPIDFHTS